MDKSLKKFKKTVKILIFEMTVNVVQLKSVGSCFRKIRF